jgi:hypothetical protein
LRIEDQTDYVAGLYKLLLGLTGAGNRELLRNGSGGIYTCFPAQFGGDFAGDFRRGEIIGCDETDPHFIYWYGSLFSQDLLDGVLHGGGQFIEWNCVLGHGYYLRWVVRDSMKTLRRDFP